MINLCFEQYFLYITVMSMGFSEGEARLGLRACEGNVQNAVAHIIKRREVGEYMSYIEWY